MTLVVAKFGGSSVSDAQAMSRVAQRVVARHRAGDQVVVVVSAMGDMTDELLDLSEQVRGGHEASKRETDMLLSAGERISMSLLAMAIEALGVRAHSFTGPQAGLITDKKFGQARIVQVEPERLQRTLDEGAIPVVAGFQGFHKDSFNTTTLGRGGSDTTAVALARALDADVCEIYSDVDGVFTADPRIVPHARKLKSVTDEEMLELAAHGAKILHLRAVEFARRHGVTLHVRSAFSEGDGTLVVNAAATDTGAEHQKPSGNPSQGENVEEPLVSGVSVDRGQEKITVVGVPDVPGAAAKLFEEVALTGANVDMVVQNVSVAGDGRTDISFTMSQGESEALRGVLAKLQEQMGIPEVVYDDTVGKLTVVGAGLRSNPGAYAMVFGSLRDAGINIEMISASEIRVSVVLSDSDLERAAQVVHTAFGLDGGPATVYAGTGR